MSKALTTVNTQAVVGSFTQSELDTLKQTIARGTTNEQFALFVQTCVNSGLNPFLNHIHCIVYNGKEGPTMSLQIAVEGILYLARKTEGYKGIDCQLVHENDEFNFNAKTKEIKHEIGFPRGKVIGGYAVAKRENFEDVVVLMEVNEVEHMLKGRNAHMWKEWFNDMFKKHLMKRAAKLQYGIEIAEDETINSSGPSIDDIPAYQPRKDITPQQTLIEQPSNNNKANEDNKDDRIAELRQQINDSFKALGIKTKKDKEEYIKKHAPNFSENPSEADLIGLLEILEMHIDMKSNQVLEDELPFDDEDSLE
jgi:recombination protein RecT